MRKISGSLIVLLVVATVFAVARPGSAQAILIDFDTDPSGNPIPSGTALTHVYSSMGLTFLHGGGGSLCGTTVYANDSHPGDFGSLPNVITMCDAGTASDISEDGFGLIEVRLDGPATQVCIEARPDSLGSPNHWAVIRGFDSGGNLIDEATSTPGVTETICVHGYRISSARFSGESNHYARFDNLGLVYHAGPVPATAYLPGAANLPGAGGTIWKTDLDITNRGGFNMTATVALLVRNQANPSPVTQSFTVAPGESLHWDNALDAIFGFGGAATLRVMGAGGDLVASSRTYNDDPSGTFGQYVPGVPLGDAVVPGRSATLIGLSQSATARTGFRTNLGLVSGCDFTITVDVELYNAAGTLLGTRSYALDAFESIQVDKIFDKVTTGGVASGYAVVSSSSTEALFFAFASVVDNSSGDGIYIPAR